MWFDRLSRFATRVSRRATPILALGLIGLVYFLGVRSERTGFVRDVLDPGLKRITQPVLNAFRGAPPKLPLLRLVVEEELLDSLEADTDFGAEQVPFPLVIEVNGRQASATATVVPAREVNDADERQTWSISITEGDSVIAMGSFELRPVSDGTSLREWLLQAALGRVGNPSLPFEFVDVKVNDRRSALYAMRGGIDVALLRNWKSGSGPVLRFDDALLRNVRGALGPRNVSLAAVPQGQWMSAPVVETPLGSPRSGARSARGERAIRSLEDFRAGRSPTWNVFDLHATARLFALGDLLGAQDACTWDRLWLIPDSATGSIVPVPMFGEALEPVSALHVQQAAASLSPVMGSGFIDHLFHDRQFFATYMAYLDTFSADGWMEHLIAGLAPEIQLHERIVSGAFPGTHFDLGVVQVDRKLIRQLLRPADLALVFANPGPNRKNRPAAANVHALPLRVIGMACGTDTILLRDETILWPRLPGKPLEYVPLPLDIEANAETPCGLLVQVIGLREIRKITIRTWSTYAADDTRSTK